MSMLQLSFYFRARVVGSTAHGQFGYLLSNSIINLSNSFSILLFSLPSFFCWHVPTNYVYIIHLWYIEARLHCVYTFRAKWGRRRRRDRGIFCDSRRGAQAKMTYDAPSTCRMQCCAPNQYSFTGCCVATFADVAFIALI